MSKTNDLTVTSEDRQIFNEKGYWISPKILDDDRIERLREAHDRIWSQDYDGDGYNMHGSRTDSHDPKRIRKLENAWWINDEVRSIVTDPVIGKIAAELLETDEIRLWHDQVILKPGLKDEVSDVGNVGWHQDYGYWQCSNTADMITVWIALQDTDLSNGAMMSIAGSHRWGFVPDSDTFFDQNMDSLRKKYEKDGVEWTEEPCILKAGQASFHHALTFHGSGPNQTSDPRLSVVAHLMPKGTAYRPNVQYHSNISYLGPRPYAGQLFANDYFPLVYQKENSN